MDEQGGTSDFIVIEYSHQAFEDSLMSVIPKWEFVVPVNTVCHAYWEFLPDRAIVTNALFDTGKRMKRKDAHGYRELRYYNEDKLDKKLAWSLFLKS